MDVPGLIRSLRAVYETFAISAPTVVDAAFARMTMAKADERLSRWSRRLLEQAQVEMIVSGREHLEPGRPYVVMSNHQSHYDIPVLFQAFPGTIRMVAKTELFRVPIFSGAMRAAGFVEIDRSNRRRAIESLRNAKQQLAQGVSIWIAPEGTRSRDGELQPFKKGGFMLALQTGLPIVPVAIRGSREILAPDGTAVRTGARVHVAFQPPITPTTTANNAAAREALMVEVRAAIERGLAGEELSPEAMRATG
jgi:1-acyl-sn-glycerol-3-phosphate acyltransferase